MSTGPENQAQRSLVLRRYKGYGRLGGGALGSIVGVMISGPHFLEWAAVSSLGVIVGGGVLGALLGWLAVGIATGSLAGGSAGTGDYGGGGDHGGGDGGGDS